MKVKPNKNSKTWWSPRVANAVHDYRAARMSTGGEATPAVIEAQRRRNKEIKLAKTASFRDLMNKAGKGKCLLWRMAKWGRESANAPNRPPRIPNLDIPEALLETLNVFPLAADRGAKTLEQTASVLRRQFFFDPIELETAGVDDNHDLDLPQEVYWEGRVTEAIVATSLARTSNDTAPGLSRVPNRFLKLLGAPFVTAIARLTEGCWHWEHYPQIFKTARTVALKKARKPNYHAAKAWRSITLLDTIGKLIESMTATTIRQLAEEHKMLPPQQMGARQGRSTKTTLALLLSQIRMYGKSQMQLPQSSHWTSLEPMTGCRKTALWQPWRKRGCLGL